MCDPTASLLLQPCSWSMSWGVGSPGGRGGWRHEAGWRQEAGIGVGMGVGGRDGGSRQG